MTYQAKAVAMTMIMSPSLWSSSADVHMSRTAVSATGVRGALRRRVSNRRKKPAEEGEGEAGGACAVLVLVLVLFEVVMLEPAKQEMSQPR